MHVYDRNDLAVVIELSDQRDAAFEEWKLVPVAIKDHVERPFNVGHLFGVIEERVPDIPAGLAADRADQVAAVVDECLRHIRSFKELVPGPACCHDGFDQQFERFGRRVDAVNVAQFVKDLRAVAVLNFLQTNDVRAAEVGDDLRRQWHRNGRRPHRHPRRGCCRSV